MQEAKLHPKSRFWLSSVLAMVLYTGKDTRVFNMALKDSPYMSRRKSVKTSFSFYTDWITYLLLFMGLLASAFVYLSFYSRRSHYSASLQLDSLFLELGEWQRYLQALALCCALVPVHLNVFQEIVLFVASIKIHSEASKALRLRKDDFEPHSNREDLESHTLERQNQLDKSRPKRTPVPFQRGYQRAIEKIHSDVDLLTGTHTHQSSRHSYIHRSATPKKRRFTGGELLSTGHQNHTPRSDSRQSVNFQETARGLIEKVESSPPQGFLPGEPKEPDLQPDLFGVEPTSFAHVTNYAVISELGNIDHLLLDKTDTLTENLLDIKYMATWRRSYQIDLGHMKQIKDDFKKNPEAHKTEDLRDNKGPVEDDFYSEKSQEHLGDLEEEITDKLFEEDPDFKKVTENIRLPFYMPVPVGYAEEQELKDQHLTEEESEESILSAPGSKAGKLSSKIEELLTTKAKGRIDLEKIEQLLFHAKKDNFGEGEEFHEVSEEEEDVQNFGEGILQPKTFEGFFYDNHSRAPEMEMMVSALALFLFCGMVV